MKQNKWLVVAIIVLLIIGSAVVVKWVPTHLGLDLVGGVRGVFQASPEEVAGQKTPGKLTPGDMATAMEVLRQRVNKLGVSEATVQQKGLDQIIVEIPLSSASSAGHMTADDAMKMLMNVVKPAVLQFVSFPDTITVSEGQKNENGEPTFNFMGPGGAMTEDQAMKQAKVLEETVNGQDVSLTGRHLLPDASAQIDPNTNEDAVTLHFDDAGAQVFADYTQKAAETLQATNKKVFFGVVLDNHLITYPYVREPILDGRGQISGGFSSLDDAQHLAILLNAGALPVKLTAVQTSLIEATLGKSAVHTSIWAGLVGLALVLLFMCLYYRLPGMLASCALLIYALIVFAIFKLVPVTLTLPGIAGFILSVGMAVDANILIFERLKEELRDGRTLRAAIDVGFSRAFTAIFDSNACTLITCGVLGFYGTGPVKGFAITLAIGVLISLFTAITVTRTFLHLLDERGALQRPEYFGINIQWMGKWAQGRDIIGGRWKYYALSLLVILPGLGFLCTGHLNLGVDFTGGNEWIIQSQQILTDVKVNKAMQEAGVPQNKYDLQIGTSLQTHERQATIHARANILNEQTQTAVIANLHEEGIADAATGSAEHIDPLIGKELEINALYAIVIASVLIVLYLTFRFQEGGFKDGVKYGVCAVIAMLHDVFVVVGLFAILGYAMHVEVDMNFVTALLTIIGFSVHDTIVIFDRVRENLRRRARGEAFEATYNRSIVQTAARSINTSFTVVLVLVSLTLLGAPVIRWFNIALLIGIISGTYSSIFNASPLVVDWQLFKRRRQEAERRAATQPAAGFGVATQVKRGPAASGEAAPRSSTSPAAESGAGARTAKPASKANGVKPATPSVRPIAPAGAVPKPTMAQPEMGPEVETGAEVGTGSELQIGAEVETGTDQESTGSLKPRSVRPSTGRSQARRKQRH